MNKQEKIDALLASNANLWAQLDKKQARIELLIKTTNMLTKELITAYDEISDLEKWKPKGYTVINKT